MPVIFNSTPKGSLMNEQEMVPVAPETPESEGDGIPEILRRDREAVAKSDTVNQEEKQEESQEGDNQN